MRDADIQGTGILRIDLQKEAGARQARADHTQLPVQCKADPAEEDRRNTVRIKVENHRFYASQSTQMPRGISFTHPQQKTRLCAAKRGTEWIKGKQMR